MYLDAMSIFLLQITYSHVIYFVNYFRAVQN